MYHSHTLLVLNKHRIKRVQYKIYKQNSGGNQMSVYQPRARSDGAVERSGAERSGRS